MKNPFNIFSYIMSRIMACLVFLGILVALTRGYIKVDGVKYSGQRMYFEVALGMIFSLFFWLWGNRIRRNDIAMQKTKKGNLNKINDPFLNIMLLILVASGLISAVMILMHKTAPFTVGGLYSSVAFGIISALALWARRKRK